MSSAGADAQPAACSVTLTLTEVECPWAGGNAFIDLLAGKQKGAQRAISSKPNEKIAKMEIILWEKQKNGHLLYMCVVHLIMSGMTYAELGFQVHPGGGVRDKV
jgi:hypothetical protein